MGTSDKTIKIMTCGSVDNGKSTLIGRLMCDLNAVHKDKIDKIKINNEIDTSLLLDGLKAEQEQGITIDISYQYVYTDTENIIIADSPGHKQYTRNMVTAATVSDIAVIVVDASKGIEEQTIRHAFLCTMFGIKKIILVVNKMDLIDWSELIYNNIVCDFENKVKKFGINSFTCIPISALLGKNIVKKSKSSWYKGNTFIEEIKNFNNESYNKKELRLPIQTQFRKDGNRYYLGTIETGVLKLGDTITICPNDISSKIKTLIVNGKESKTATFGDAVTIQFEDYIDVSRGDIITHTTDKIKCPYKLTANIVWMSKDIFDESKTYIIKSLTKTMKCSVYNTRNKLDVNTLEIIYSDFISINDISNVVIEPHGNICLEKFSDNQKTGSFILIDDYTNETVATGIVT